ncbi:MAG: hypothetical protein A2Y14_04800 [Verrucomicrobia bacterium GWF2_51_19]|nr:MAG: hypothetical protein A2Y14_04800 [Verrucomicrobia bacterium GWF2_51_19]HCJ12274.1 hypothetical protein [Opitutae bacterium]
MDSTQNISKSNLPEVEVGQTNLQPANTTVSETGTHTTDTLNTAKELPDLLKHLPVDDQQAIRVFQNTLRLDQNVRNGLGNTMETRGGKLCGKNGCLTSEITVDTTTFKTVDGKTVKETIKETRPIICSLEPIPNGNLKNPAELILNGLKIARANGDTSLDKLIQLFEKISAVENADPRISEDEIKALYKTAGKDFGNLEYLKISQDDKGQPVLDFQITGKGCNVLKYIGIALENSVDEGFKGIGETIKANFDQMQASLKENSSSMFVAFKEGDHYNLLTMTCDKEKTTVTVLPGTEGGTTAEIATRNLFSGLRNPNDKSNPTGEEMKAALKRFLGMGGLPNSVGDSVRDRVEETGPSLTGSIGQNKSTKDELNETTEKLEKLLNGDNEAKGLTYDDVRKENEKLKDKGLPLLPTNLQDSLKSLLSRLENKGNLDPNGLGNLDRRIREIPEPVASFLKEKIGFNKEDVLKELQTFVAKKDASLNLENEYDIGVFNRDTLSVLKSLDDKKFADNTYHDFSYLIRQAKLDQIHSERDTVLDSEDPMEVSQDKMEKAMETLKTCIQTGIPGIDKEKALKVLDLIEKKRAPNEEKKTIKIELVDKDQNKTV